MRPPNPRMANVGSGRDTITVFTLDIDNATATDEEGNWVRKPVVGTTYLAVVTPSMATGVEADGSALSMTTYEVMLYTNVRPFPIKDAPVEWKKNGSPRGVLVPMGEASPSGAGAWAFTAVETGPDPSTTGLPDGVE